MNPTMMEAALDTMGVQWARVDGPRLQRGIVRVQWDGPWMQPGVAIQVRYRRIHWIAADRTTNRCWIFDINCISCGGGGSRKTNGSARWFPGCYDICTRRPAGSMPRTSFRCLPFPTQGPEGASTPIDPTTHNRARSSGLR